jgi:hypothetical protein
VASSFVFIGIKGWVAALKKSSGEEAWRAELVTA